MASQTKTEKGSREVNQAIHRLHQLLLSDQTQSLVRCAVAEPIVAVASSHQDALRHDLASCEWLAANAPKRKMQSFRLRRFTLSADASTGQMREWYQRLHIDVR